MIKQNLGIIERLVRILLGLGLGGWALLQPELGAVEAVALLVAGFLVLNCVFGRCYLWSLLNVNTCEPRDNCCGRHNRRAD